MIELNRVTVGYGKQTVLKDVSVEFEKRSLTSIIGVNGCGKTTLLKAVLGMIPLCGGEIAIDGRKTGDMTRNEIARKLAYLSQSKNIPNMTVEQMVLHGRFPHLSYPRRYSRKDREIVCSAMEQAGISSFAQKSLPELSGGMRQNAYIAMALAQSTEYVLLDEPTIYLDISHQLELMKTLRKLADDGKGIIAVMHDLPMAFTFSDRIILLNGGKVVSDGEPKQVFEQKAINHVFGISLECLSDGKSYCYKY